MSTGISWCDETWNPIRGCSRVSEGCRNCYAETMAGRIVAMGRGKPTPYDGLVRVVGGESRWTGVVAFDAAKLAEPLKRKRAKRYFVNSMSDLFHEGLTNEQIAAVFGVMAAAPQHTFIVLTKRAKRMREWFEFVGSTAYTSFGDGRGQMTAEGCRDEAFNALGIPQEAHMRPLWSRGLLGYDQRWPLPNVILGVSVENQETADERIPHLLATPAAVRAVSAEPLLGPLRLDDIGKGWSALAKTFAASMTPRGERVGLDWVIAGCESGRGARPCEVDWLRSLRDQCAEAQVPFFLKQARADELGYGGSEVLPVTTGIGSTRKPSGAVGRGIIELPYLDGVQYAAMPEVEP